MVAAGFGLFFAYLGLGQVGHTQQGYSCTLPPQNQACSNLAAQEQVWNGVQVLAILAFVAGLVITLLPRGRRDLGDEEPRPPVV